MTDANAPVSNQWSDLADVIHNSRDMRELRYGQKPEVVGRAVASISKEILEAGYRKPRTITTQAELNVLPAGAIIRDADEDPLKKDADGYWRDGSGGPRCWRIPLPAHVLWEPRA